MELCVSHAKIRKFVTSTGIAEWRESFDDADTALVPVLAPMHHPFDWGTFATETPPIANRRFVRTTSLSGEILYIEEQQTSPLQS